MYYAASSLVCVPASLTHNGPALGAQAGEHRISELVKAQVLNTLNVLLRHHLI